MSNKNIKQITVETYNKSARELAEYFNGIGSRVDDIEKAIELCNAQFPCVLEIGCGDGRDAKEIVKRAKTYYGFDISSELISIAKEAVQEDNAIFEVQDATEFHYGINKYDVVFAFASLLHLNKSEFGEVIEKVYKALRSGGVFFISLKYSEKYEERIKEDRFGTRQFFFYNIEIIMQLNKGLFKITDMSKGFTTGGNTKWVDLLLIKE